MLLERGITVSYETIRRWGIKFGPNHARRLRRKQPSRTDVWHLDEMVITITGRKCWLWRAVDQDGYVLDDEMEAPGGPKQTAVELVQFELKRRMLNLEVLPGAKLHVDNLRREFDVSTATMREALSRLLIDNLVSSEPQRGFRVRELSYADFRNLSDTRKIVEVGALRLSLANRDDDWEGALASAYHKLKLIEDRMISQDEMGLVSDWHRRNSEFHDSLVKNCRNNWLTEFRRQLHEHSNRYLRIALLNNRKHRDVREEHAAIFASAMAGDISRCSQLIEDHIETSVGDIANHLPRTAAEFDQILR